MPAARIIFTTLATVLLVANRDARGEKASGEDGRLRVTLEVSHSTIAPGEYLAIRADYEAVRDTPLLFPRANRSLGSNERPAWARLVLRDPNGRVASFPRSTPTADQWEEIIQGADDPWVGTRQGTLIAFRMPMVRFPDSPRSRRQTFLRGFNLRQEGVYEVWVEFSIPPVEDAPTNAWHGVLVTDRVRVRVRELPVKDRSSEPTAEQLQLLSAFLTHRGAADGERSSNQGNDRETDSRELLDQLRTAMTKTENEGLALHIVELMRESYTEGANSDTSILWWGNTQYLIEQRAFIREWRGGPCLRIIGPYLDEYAELQATMLENNLEASARNQPHRYPAHLDLLLCYLIERPSESLDHRLHRLAARYSRLPDVQSGTAGTTQMLGVCWKILFALGVLHDGMAMQEAEELLGEAWRGQEGVVGWRRWDGSKCGGKTAIVGKVTAEAGVETIRFTQRP